MDNYNYNLDLPFSKIKLEFREINTQQQLDLAKACVSFDSSPSSLLDFYNYCNKIIKSCVLNVEDLEKIDIVEYIFFLVKIRMISIGSTVDFLLNDNSKTKTKIQVDFQKYLLNLYNASNTFETLEINDEIFKIKLRWPDIKSINHFYEFLKTEKHWSLLNDTLCEFIDIMYFKDLKMDFKQLTVDERVKLFEKIPVKYKDKIQNEVFNACNLLFNFDLFELTNFKDYKFNFYNLSFIEHIRLLFSYDVRSIYEEIWFFASNNLDPNYILGISNSERKIYSSIIAEHNSRKNKSNTEVPENAGQNSGYSDDVKKLALEFGDELG
jgi:hypothetical protein